MPSKTVRNSRLARSDDQQPTLLAGVPSQKPGSNGPGSANTSVPASVRSASISSPSKARAKSAVKLNVKTPPKPASKPISSFFNAAVQRQQVLRRDQAEESPSKAVAVYEDVEVIHDDTDDDTQSGNLAITALSQGSSTALAMRKRKFQRVHSTENGDSTASRPSQRFRTANSSSAKSARPAKPESTLPWTERFPPSNLSELAVHKRKVSDTRDWLQSTFQNRRQKVLILKGPAGTGKTMTVRLLAQDLGIELVEWSGATAPDRIVDDSESALSRFEEFTARARGSSALPLLLGGCETAMTQLTSASDSEDVRPRALLIEEFPSTFSKTSNALHSFRSTVSQFVSTAVPLGSWPTPMIMIISETLLSTNTAAADSFTAHRLLGPELTNNPHINVIEFNPVAPTYLVKALELTVVKEARRSGRRKTPGLQVLKQLAEVGDIRSAVSSLEFLCLRGDESDIWSSKVAFTKPKRSAEPSALTEAEKASLELINHRESSLGIFHSVGKVVYNKRLPPGDLDLVVKAPPWLEQYERNKVPETDVDVLLNELGTDISTFVSALHENYVLSCSSASTEAGLESLLGCMENLSDSDMLSLERLPFGTRSFSASTTESLRQDEISFQTAVRGILLRLPYPVHRGVPGSGNGSSAYRMLYPASMRLWRRQSETHAALDTLQIKIRSYIANRHFDNDTSHAVSETTTNVSKRNKSGVDTPGAKDESKDLESRTAQNCTELLLFTLPYMAQVLGSRNAPTTARPLFEQISSITRMSGAAFAIEDDEFEGDGDEPAAESAEQWSTDRPDDADTPSLKGPRKPRVQRKHKHIFDAMAIPVETREEKLILEEDDIEDD